MEEEKKFLSLQLDEIFEALTATLDFLKTSKKINLVQAKVQRVDELKKEYDNLRKDILKFNSKVSSIKESISTRMEAFNTLFDAIYASYIELKDSKSGSKPQEPGNFTPMINLQPLKLINFEGNIDKWLQFISLFDSLVHNNPAIPDIQKHHYLRAHLFGEAASLIENIALEEGNYLLCYNTLHERYSSPRRLINFYAGLILNFNSKETRNYSNFLTAHSNAVNGIKNLKLTDALDSILFHLCYRNLSNSDKQAFDNSCNFKTIPTTEHLFEFLKRRVHTSELQVDLAPKAENKTTLYRPPFKRAVTLLAAKNKPSVSPNYNCTFCSGRHRIYSCSKFLKASMPERKTWVLRTQKCMKCLGNHPEVQCSSKNCCKACQSSNHHSLLHESSNTKDSLPQCFLTRATKTAVLLGTLNLSLKSRDGEWITARCLMDSASQINLMTTDCAKRLKLPINPVSSVISGVSCKVSRTTGSLKCEINLGNQIRSSNFMILDTICCPQPNFVVPISIRNRFKNMQLADENFHINSQIDILLGSEIVSQLISNIEPIYIPGEPSAVRTHVGYVLLGKMELNLENDLTSLAITNSDLNKELRKFWEVENLDLPKLVSPEDEYCEDLFTKTTTRDITGRYQVRLPFRPQFKLTSNRNRVLASYIYSEKKLLKDLSLKKAYDQFLLDFLNSDFMELAKSEAKYLHTHHAVFKDSSSTSLRVVLNGSTPDSQGQSLNSVLYSGPKLQASLPHILTHFRSHTYVVIADISKMFNQIILHPNDRLYQHIFWRPPNSDKIQEYEMKRLSFGHVSSPWLALRVIKQLVHDEGANYPYAAQALSHCTYIDDIITGADSIQKSCCLINELKEMLAKGGFQLKKWISNTPELLHEVSDSELETPKAFKDESIYFKVLGITWLPKEDVFSFITVKFDGTATRRNILSYVSRLFDPCGWVCPVILRAKTFIQKSWVLGTDWDEELPSSLALQWSEFVREFHLLSSLKIPRRIPVSKFNFRLIGFSDGSTEAYGCCVYVQALDPEDTKCSLLRAKSKVCPLRTLSIPRIELLAAHLLVKLINSILQDSGPFIFEEVFYFTDSQIVLHWIKSSPHTLKTFVANRVSEIQESSNPSQWRHVSSHENPSDPISRGLSPSQLLICDLYWKGPSFLIEPQENWPVNPTINVDHIPDKKNSTCLNATEATNFVDFFSRYSTLTKLQNVVAYLKRFIYNCKNSKAKLTGPLNYKERKEALIICAYVTQRHYFSEEIRLLQNHRKSLPAAFQRLSPFLEEGTNLIRAGGRLRFSNLPYNSKHPILLPKSAHFSLLLCNHFHLISMHSGVTLMTALIHKEWWIFSLRRLLRKILFSCLKCYKLKAKPPQPFMADLPTARISISRAFTHVGTDFGGPFPIKESLRRNAKISKAYLCIFVCFATKAVHLEVVSNLSTEAFLACFDRFVARRSLPTCVYSDRGTNYQGARNRLREIQLWLENEKDEILSAMASRRVDWKFSPPNAPNFGGLWESVIKSSKNLLLRSIADTALTFEELVTLCTRIEAILNSRPLTPLTSTPEDELEILTPGHFLVGGPLLSLPEEVNLEDVSPKTRWINLQQKTRFFWKRWTTEYLHTLTQRSKWNKTNLNLQIGDLVWLTKLHCSPLAWPLGRIIDTHPGKDGITRVVTVKTAHGCYTRASSSLIPFPKQEG